LERTHRPVDTVVSGRGGSQTNAAYWARMSGSQPVLVVPDEPIPDPNRAARPYRRLRTLAVLATAVTILLVAIGGLVRATGSGLGCPGWPRCFGRWVPPLRYHALIEYSHRFTAFLDVVLIGVLGVTAVARYRWAPRLVGPALAAFGLVIAQAVLGAIVVKGELNALLVSAHFGTAMILVGTLVYATVASFTMEATIREETDGLTRLARAAAASVFALLVVGAYVRGEGAGLVFTDWPLMNGKLVPRLSSVRPAIHFTHRALALVVGIVVAVLIVQAWRRRARRPVVASLSVVAGVLFVAQALVGAANVWSRLAPAAVVAHVAMAGLLWSVMVAIAATARVDETSLTPVVSSRAGLGGAT
jgi:heme a synthase